MQGLTGVRAGGLVATLQGIVALVIAVAAPVAAETLIVPGSGNPEALLGRLAAAFNAGQAAHQVVVPPSTGTAGALRDIEQGVATIARVGRPLKDEERRTGIQFHPLGRDAVVFVGGAGVSLRGISRDQAVQIYSGRLGNWKDLGGNPGPIRAIGRESTDASRQAINREIKAFESLVFADMVKVVHLDPQMIELLDRYPTSLGFLNRSALSAARTAVVPLALDGIDPAAASLAAGRYPMFLELGLIYKPGALTDAGKAFLRFVDSDAGRQIGDQLSVVRPAGKP